MANDMRYLSAEEEAKLLKPIDEYVGKIQAQIDALRVDGSDQVQALKTHISLTKEDKNYTKEEQNEIIRKDQALLVKAREVEAANKNKVIKAKDIDTKVTGRTTGHPVRCLRNQQTREYLKLEQAGASFEELEKLTLGGLRKAVVDGDVIHGSVMAGQIAGLVKDSRSCKEIIEGICREMKDVVLSQAENIGR